MTGGGPEWKTRIYRYMAEDLADGEWHYLEPLLALVGRLVPPGRALRAREADRLRKSRDGARPVSHEDMIRRGARRVVRDEMLGVRPDRPFEIRVNDDGVSQIRMIKLPAAIRGDRRREQYLRAPFDGLADHFKAMGLTYAMSEVQASAHELGFHLTTCPEDCRLVRLAPRPVPTDEE